MNGFPSLYGKSVSQRNKVFENEHEEGATEVKSYVEEIEPTFEQFKAITWEKRRLIMVNLLKKHGLEGLGKIWGVSKESVRYHAKKLGVGNLKGIKNGEDPIFVEPHNPKKRKRRTRKKKTSYSKSDDIVYNNEKIEQLRI